MIVVGNRELTSATLKNYRGIKARRMVEGLTFVASTPNKKLEQLQVDLPIALQAIPRVTFKRIHFNSFGQYGLEHTLVYEIEADSYDEHIATKNIVNLVLKRYLEQKKLELAYPTQTVVLKKK